MGLAILAHSLSRFRLQYARYHADADAVWYDHCSVYSVVRVLE